MILLLYDPPQLVAPSPGPTLRGNQCISVRRQQYGKGLLQLHPSSQPVCLKMTVRVTLVSPVSEFPFFPQRSL